MKKTVLIVEDDETQRVLLEAFLRKRMNLHSYVAENGRKALEILRDKKGVELVISDIEMPVMNGIDTLRDIKNRFPNMPVIMLTGSKNTDHVVTAMKLGAADFVAKPYDPERMRVTINNVLAMTDLHRTVQKLERVQGNIAKFEDMIGYDGGLGACVKLGRKAAMIDLPVLIQGETGTGKELFAKAIHGESTVSGGSFITVNCGAIPSELVESTLFGHEKGAFTGATEAAVGKFREADGGTLFLDEIGELPIEAQVKLLRVIQEQEVEPVGSARAVKVNVRIISATHRDLSADVKQGLFREDLFYRLNVLDITMPALKDRGEDVEQLADYFMHQICRRANIALKSFSPKVYVLFRHYDWPGNVRQLENSINRAVILSDHDELQVTDFVLQGKRESDAIPQTDDSKPSQNIKTIADMEITMIREALHAHKGNVTATARSLGMAKSTLYRKIRAHNIQL